MRIEWSEFLAWQKLRREIVRPEEWSILRAMDLAYCEALQDEIDNSSAIAANPPKAGAGGAAGAKHG